MDNIFYFAELDMAIEAFIRKNKKISCIEMNRETYEAYAQSIQKCFDKNNENYTTETYLGILIMLNENIESFKMS